jgi:putative serine protease PepD
VTRIAEGGPADRAGLRPGDVITGVDGRPVTDLHHFHDALSRRQAGDMVEVTLWREGETSTVRAVLEDYR